VNDLHITRRQLLAGAGAALAAVPLAAPAHGAAADSSTEASTIVLQDRRYTLPQDVIQQLGGNGARVIALDADPVRQWRGEQATLLADRGARLLGVTTWPAFLMVRGLAEESGRRVRYHRLDVASGAIVWLMA
jgi:hypothetical protein